jgi:ABC-2 type transport system permease protein
VSRPGTIGWFALHEARLAWRDWLWLMTGGNRRRASTVAVGFLAFALFMHGLAYLMLSHSGYVTAAVDTHVLVVITGTLVLTFALMLSQAIEAVTRAFYARGDLELILTSPAAARLFAIRIAAMAVTTLAMALVMGASFINVLAWLGGPRWLGAYGVAMALAMVAVAVAVAITGALFRAIGPRRTRFIAQIVAALTGAAFAIGVQFAAILSFGSMAVPQLAVLARLATDRDSVILWPARAVFGDPAALAALLGTGIVALAAAIRVYAPRFGRLALAASDASYSTQRQSRRQKSHFRSSSAGQALRRNEWTLLLRDPWLMSQTLMQLLYLLPAAFLLWRNFYGGGDVSALLVPILIVTAGQLGGGLAWLAVSGEDAPDLIASAPIPSTGVLRAKAEAVLAGLPLYSALLWSCLPLPTPSPRSSR